MATPSQARLMVEAGAYDRPGEAAGPAPMELMLASLVTCAGSTLDAVLAKMRFEVAGLNVVADAERADRVPRVYAGIDLEFHVASGAPEDRLLHAIEVTERTCSASFMLSQVTDLSARLVHVRRVEPAETRLLRQQILRPHQSLDELATEEDPAAVWFGAVVAGEVVGTLSLIPETSPNVADAAHPFRLRSMATSNSMQGRGLGRVLLAAGIAHVGSLGGDLIWCSARLSAAGFYRQAGFMDVSERYEVEHIGTHVHMALRL